MKQQEFSVSIGGKEMTAVFSDLAEQAHGAVILRYGETVVLATAVMSKDGTKNPGFFNLSVDYVEKFYAAGKILGSRFMRREGKPSDEAVLAGRVIDRTIRPLFDQHIKNAVQVIVTVLALGDEDPGILAVNAVSLALATSEIPWRGPVGAVRIRQKDGALIVNPSKKDAGQDTIAGQAEVFGGDNYDYDLIVCGKDGNINMIEAISYEINEEEIVNGFNLATTEITKLENFQKEIISKIGKEKRKIEKKELSAESLALFNENIAPKMKESIFAGAGKKKIDELHNIWNTLIAEKFPDMEDDGPEDDHFDNEVNRILHEEAILNDKRADGRKMDELRDLYAQAGGFSKMLHGSGIFYRGGTHVLSVLTLGGPDDANTINSMETAEEKRFMHHYNFPPYSAGETGRATMTNRREIGHGALAEKALFVVLPSKEVFPYTIRVVSESMASNGSTSQASICAATLALMDGGVPIKAPVAGIAMGLMTEENEPFESAQGKNPKYKILTDIQGPEDHHGDMDFKVAGTKNGVTAIQLDVKVEGVPVKIIAETLTQGKTARLQILETITKAISEPRKDISSYAPKILVMTIRPDQIGMVIGSGGKVINGIKDDTGAEITIEDDGTVYVTGKNGSAEKALKIIEEMTHEYKIGEVFNGEVVKVIEVGAIVRIASGTEGLVHISEIGNFRVNKVSDFLKEGMLVPVKVVGVDPERGRISLSIKAISPDFIKAPQSPQA